VTANSDFEPKRRLISSVTNAANAVVTTTEDHEYTDGMIVRVFVPLAYGMTLYDQTEITVTASNAFSTNINTSAQSAFVEPTFSEGNGFTQAQVIPITGTTQNVA
jgi:hypothetical protein